MTRDGAISVDLATGEASRISDREAEQDFSASNDTAGLAGDIAQRLDDRHIRKGEKKKRKERRDTFREGEAAAGRPSSRLQFTEEEHAAPELQKSILRSDTAADRLDAARDAIPKKCVLTKTRIFDEATGKGQTKLIFKESEKPTSFNQHANPVSRPLQEAGAAIHGKVREVEQDNSGVQAGHLGERGFEKAVGFGSRRIRSMRANSKLKLWRAASQSEQAAVKANAEFLYQKALLENPQLAGSNPVSRLWQKKRLQRQYAAAYRAAGSTAQTVQGTAKTAEATAKAAKKTAEETGKAASFVAKHGKGFLIFGGILLLLLLLIGGLQSCTSIFGGGVSNIVASSYLSEDSDLLAAEAAYCAKEDELRQYLDTYEATHDYDEYHFDLDDIEHDPYVLLSILSALHEGVFTIDEVQGDLEMLFEKQYILTETVVKERRYTIETDTWTGEDGVTHTDSYRVYYDYFICTVRLENFNLSHVPIYIMGEDTLSLYATYMSTLGNRADLFPTSDYVSKYITNRPAAYTIPAEALADATFATLITEAEKYLGYPYVWGGSLPSTSFDCSGFVSYVLTNSGLCNTGRLGAQGLYNISTPVSSANVQPGDLVFFVGTYDTPGISHVGIYVGDGMMLHCGDPINYTNLNSSYWQSHFYAYGRPPY